MQSIALRILIDPDHPKDADERNKENIEEVKKNLNSSKGNLGILKYIYIKKKVDRKLL